MSWDQRYLDGDIPWDKGAAAPPLVELLRDHPEYFMSQDVVVPGCGHGHDALAIANAGFATIGLDLSPTALARAEELNTQGLVNYLAADFLAVPHHDLPDVHTIFEHTCLCAIDPSERVAYRDACARLLPTGGYWVAIIFVKPRDEDDPTIGPPFQCKVAEVTALFETEFDLIDSYQPGHTFAGRQGREQVMVWLKK